MSLTNPPSAATGPGSASAARSQTLKKSVQAAFEGTMPSICPFSSPDSQAPRAAETPDPPCPNRALLTSICSASSHIIVLLASHPSAPACVESAPSRCGSCLAVDKTSPLHCPTGGWPIRRERPVWRARMIHRSRLGSWRWDDSLSINTASVSPGPPAMLPRSRNRRLLLSGVSAGWI